MKQSSGFLVSKHHRFDKLNNENRKLKYGKHNYRPHFGSLSRHKCWAKTRMNSPLKLKLIDKGMEKIFLLCDRALLSNQPKQFIKPPSVILKSQRRHYMTVPLNEV